ECESSLFSCGMSRDLWAHLARWCDLNIPEISHLSEWISWLDDCQVTKKARFILEGIAASMLWSIWKFSNELIFSVSKPKKATIWDFIVHQSFLWISSRNPKFCLSWIAHPQSSDHMAADITLCLFDVVYIPDLTLF
ncbi:hypothetical protein Tco_0093996, partial [Tanacetum coccineum]